MLAVANRKYDQLHKNMPYHDGKEQIWSDKYSEVTPWHYRDGVTVYLARMDVNPDDDFLGGNSSKDAGVFVATGD